MLKPFNHLFPGPVLVPDWCPKFFALITGPGFLGWLPCLLLLSVIRAINSLSQTGIHLKVESGCYSLLHYETGINWGHPRKTRTYGHCHNDPSIPRSSQFSLSKLTGESPPPHNSFCPLPSHKNADKLFILKPLFLVSGDKLTMLTGEKNNKGKLKEHKVPN